MEWKNLATFTCPHCTKPLRDEGKEISCTECFFNIERPKYDSILKNRVSEPTGPITKLKWQNLLDGNCPACGEKIEPKEKGAIFKCTNDDCTFVIRRPVFTEILADKNHPVYRFHKDHNKLEPY